MSDVKPIPEKELTDNLIKQANLNIEAAWRKPKSYQHAYAAECGLDTLLELADSMGLIDAFSAVADIKDKFLAKLLKQPDSEISVTIQA